MPVSKKKKPTNAKKSIKAAAPTKPRKLGKKVQKMIIGAAATAILGTGLYSNSQRIKKLQKKLEEAQKAAKAAEYDLQKEKEEREALRKAYASTVAEVPTVADAPAKESSYTDRLLRGFRFR